MRDALVDDYLNLYRRILSGRLKRALTEAEEEVLQEESDGLWNQMTADDTQRARMEIRALQEQLQVLLTNSAA